MDASVEVNVAKRKRYDDYCDVRTETIARLPAHWRVSRLKYAIDINTEVLTDATDPDVEIQYIDIGNVDSLGNILELQTMRFDDAPSRARRIVRNGDVIVSTVRTYLKAIATIQDAPNNLIVSTGFAVLRAKEDLYPPFLARLVHAKEFVDMVVNHSEGVGYPAINPNELSRLPIWLPPLAEQRAIAAFLDRETARIDALIARKQRLIELLDEKRQAVISNAVTKGLNPRISTKDSKIEWFGLVPEHWQVTRLGCVCKTINDINHEMPEGVDCGIPFLSAKDLLNDGTLNFTENVKFISEVDFERLSRKILPTRNDIIYSRIGACLGKARLVETDERFLISYSCCIVRVDPVKALPSFFRYLLDTDLVLTEATMRTQGIGVPDLGLKQIARFPVTLPPLKEQASIVEYLDQKLAHLRTLTHRVKDGIDRLQEYRTALISAAVTGQIDVREEVELDG